MNPNLQQLTQLGQNLSSFNFEGALSPLQQTIQFNPEIIKSALSQAQGLLQPQFKQLQQQAVNTAAANNQLGTSTFTSALANVQENIASQFQAIVSGAAVSSAHQALQNRIALVGAGANISQSALQGALSSQGQENTFNAQNFQNQLGQFAANQSGGIFGALTGGIGGALGGAALAPFTGGASLFPALLGGIGGAAAGGFGAPGTGGSLLQAGTLARALPGSTAGAFGGIGSQAGGFKFGIPQNQNAFQQFGGLSPFGGF